MRSVASVAFFNTIVIAGLPLTAADGAKWDVIPLKTKIFGNFCHIILININI